MAFSVSYGSSMGALAVKRETAREAIAQALEWINAGQQNVVMTDLSSGQKYDANEIRLAKERIDRLERNA